MLGFRAKIARAFSSLLIVCGAFRVTFECSWRAKVRGSRMTNASGHKHENLGERSGEGCETVH